MKHYLAILIALVAAGSHSISPALAEDFYFGNFDDMPSYYLTNSGSDPLRTGWFDWTGVLNGTSVNTSTTIGVTTGTQSLAWQPGAVGFNQGLSYKVQIAPAPVDRDAIVQGFLNNTHVAMNVSWDRNEWVAQHNGDIGSQNFSQIASLVINYGPNGNFASQGAPDIDTGNNNFKGGWDPVNYTDPVHTRIVMWDYSDIKPQIQALVTAGTTTGVNGWLEFMITTNAGDYNYPITYYFDSMRFTTPQVGVQGDYNGNGTVDAADYILWRNGGPLQNEVDAAGTVNAADYDAWRARFGNTSNPGAGSAVPEPTAWLLAMVLLSAIGLRRRAV
jgi:hypothetical protein